MSIFTATTRDQMPSNDHVVAAPRKSDSIGGALRTAFGHHEAGTDDFSALLQRIDLADRAIGSC
ncbi:MAG: hypothetical protein ABIS51_03825 [Sphingomonas sp.]